jgi:hypothetical protein
VVVFVGAFLSAVGGEGGRPTSKQVDGLTLFTTGTAPWGAGRGGDAFHGAGTQIPSGLELEDPTARAGGRKRLDPEKHPHS